MHLWRGRGSRLQCEGNFFERAAQSRVRSQTAARDIEKRRLQVLRNDRIASPCSVPGRRVLRQHLHQRHAQRPDIPSRRHTGVAFGRAVRVRRPEIVARLAGPQESVTRDLHPIAGSHDVRGSQATVHEALRVNIRQGLQHRRQHFARLGRSQPAGWNHLRKIFVSLLHDNVDQASAIELTGSDVEEGK